MARCEDYQSMNKKACADPSHRCETRTDIDGTVLGIWCHSTDAVEWAWGAPGKNCVERCNEIGPTFECDSARIHEAGRRPAQAFFESAEAKMATPPDGPGKNPVFCTTFRGGNSGDTETIMPYSRGHPSVRTAASGHRQAVRTCRHPGGPACSGSGA